MAQAGQLLAAAVPCLLVGLCECKDGASGSQDRSGSGSGGAADETCWLVPPPVCLFLLPMGKKKENES